MQTQINNQVSLKRTSSVEINEGQRNFGVELQNIWHVDVQNILYQPRPLNFKSE